MFNEEQMKMILDAKMNEIIAGDYPEGVSLKERTENRIVLVPGKGFILGSLQINRLDLSITHNGTEIVFTNA